MTPAEANPVARLLGAQAAAGGPLALLGLASALATPDQVIAARDRRIAELDAHPLSQTPEADEVRLAIHAAAANLLDPRVRSVLQGGRAGAAAPALAHALERDALLAIGMHGGLTPRALRRLSIVAHARGHTAPDIARAVRGLARQRPAPPRAPRPAAAPPRAKPPAPRGAAPEPEPIDEAWRVAAVIAASVLGSALVLGGIVLLIVRASADPPAQRIAGESAEQRSAIVAPPGAEQPPAQRTDLDAPGVIAHELRSAAAAFSQEAEEGLERFALATRSLAAQWSRADPGRVARANDAVLGFVRLAGVQGVERLDTVGPRQATGAEAITRGAWAAGMLGAIAADDRVEPAASRAAAERLVVLGLRPEPSFESAAVAFLEAAVASPSPSDADAWAAWADALAAASPRGTEPYATVMLDAHDRLLRDSSAPSQAAVDLLVDRTDWRADDPSRPWLLRAFDASDAPVERLSMIVASLARRSAAAGVAADMTLPPDAPPEVRGQVRDRFAAAWGLRVAGQDDRLVRTALDALAAAADVARAATGDLARVRALAHLAHACAGAEMLVWGHDEPAGEVLMAVEASPPADSPTPASPDLSAPDGDGSWGARLLNAASSDATTEHLRRIKSDAPRLGPADAGVLVELAFRGPGDVRQAAAEAAVACSGSLHVILAALEALEGMPRTAHAAATLEAMTGTRLSHEDRAGFSGAARAALLGRLLDIITAGSAQARLDDAAALVDERYALALSDSAGIGQVPPAHASAAMLGARWARQGQGRAVDASLSPAAIQARRDALLPLAPGPIARLVIEQRAMVETMAAAIGAEPASARRAAAAMERLIDADARAGDAFDQLLAGELARAALLTIALEAPQ